MNLLLRLVLVLGGLVFAVSLAAAGIVLFAVWGVRLAWARVTGRPVTPFSVRIDPFGAFAAMVRRGGEASRTPRADAAHGGRREIGDVTDVEPRPPAR